MRFRHSAHAEYKTEYHIVWTPRYRRRLLKQGVKQYLERMLMELEGLDEDIEVVKVNVQEDHVHLVVVVPPRIAVARVVQFMESRTGKRLNEKFEFMSKAVSGKPGMWSRGYCVSTVGLNEKAILAYVEYQERKDKGQLEIDLGRG